MNPAATLVTALAAAARRRLRRAQALAAAARRRLRRAQAGAADLNAHLRGQACQRPVLVHSFIAGTVLGFRPSRCVFLASETDPWCTLPRRCHLMPPGAGIFAADLKAAQQPPAWWWPPAIQERLIQAYVTRHESGHR